MLAAAEGRLLFFLGRLTGDRIQTLSTMELERFIRCSPSLPYHLLPSRPKEGSMKRVASLFSAGVLTGIREAAPKKLDQSQDTAVKYERGNV
jgi:hypothetical protein